MACLRVLPKKFRGFVPVEVLRGAAKEWRYADMPIRRFHSNRDLIPPVGRAEVDELPALTALRTDRSIRLRCRRAERRLVGALSSIAGQTGGQS